ncbi:uncharacterized protein N7469_002229 [Penicillium citrinum]|uniref:ABC transporter domain-containing protein n=1 Tax=Penicillium citrinum TaxID=5077 RepID=A0A9W9TU03_PENCI|nr:uncharacterized protein N7469_002229 [Penicillium citrinum]KAJ5240638.1 hypothetical protein N7469_002229 [Penicillium citrinum]
MEDQQLDLERNGDSPFLANRVVQSLYWKDLTVTVKNRSSGKPLNLITEVNGYVKQGELLALMGPSGCGKTTLLNLLARRDASPRAKIRGEVFINGTQIDRQTFQLLSSYVEQEDVLIGSLTVKETMKFAADLSLPGYISKDERISRTSKLLQSFGIQKQADTLVGTPIRKGISGGQKRRLSVASQLITSPKILFMDEPTSGLDSTSSFEVISFTKRLAQDNNLHRLIVHKLLVILSIHQPSTTTFELFDKLLLLADGKACYFGSLHQIEGYFSKIAYPIPSRTNPAEFLLDLVTADFVPANGSTSGRRERIQSAWAESTESEALMMQISAQPHSTEKRLVAQDLDRPTLLKTTLTLVHRLFIKSYRDFVAYEIRILMYLALAIMMGTVWLRLQTSQNYIQPLINAIFFGSAFMSFMAVAYVPAFLEDRATFVKERSNGLYGPLPFMISNFLIGLPYLLLFSVISYWLSNFYPNVDAFFTWVMWIFLDLVTAESLVVFASSMFPNFVIALAIVAFANGLWMCVGGFLVPLGLLNPFWKYVFHYIDYQAYVFQGMLVNELARRIYSCDANCHCMFSTDLAPHCQIRGSGILELYGYSTGKTAEWVGILLAIIAAYRLLGWIAIALRHR